MASVQSPLNGEQDSRRQRTGDNIVSHHAVATGKPLGETDGSRLQDVEEAEGNEGGKPPAPVERHHQQRDPLSGDLVNDDGRGVFLPVSFW